MSLSQIPHCYLTRWASSSYFQADFFIIKMRIMDLSPVESAEADGRCLGSILLIQPAFFPVNHTFITLLSEE